MRWRLPPIYGVCKMGPKSEEKIENVHCNRCLHTTKHFVVAERKKMETEENDEGHETSAVWRYTMLECCGCGEATLREVFDWSDEGVEEVNFYPPQVSRQQPRWQLALPYELRDLLKEIYSALHSDSRRLVLMGARTLVDIFMNDKVGDIGGFAPKLDALVKDGYLSIKSKDVLKAALEAGDAAAHRGYNPKRQEVIHVLDIVENLIQSYALEESAGSLKNTTPSRQRKAPPTT